MYWLGKDRQEKINISLSLGEHKSTFSESIDVILWEVEKEANCLYWSS